MSEESLSQHVWEQKETEKMRKSKHRTDCITVFWRELVSFLGFLVFADRRGSWCSSAAEAHLLQDSVCCSLRDDQLHTSVVARLFELWLVVYHFETLCPLSLDLWHQQSIFKNIFNHWIFFFFFGPWRWLCLKTPRRTAASEISLPANLAPTITSQSKSPR